MAKRLPIAEGRSDCGVGDAVTGIVIKAAAAPSQVRGRTEDSAAGEFSPGSRRIPDGRDFRPCAAGSGASWDRFVSRSAATAARMGKPQACGFVVSERSGPTCPSRGAGALIPPFGQRPFRPSRPRELAGRGGSRHPVSVPGRGRRTSVRRVPIERESTSASHREQTRTGSSGFGDAGSIEPHRKNRESRSKSPRTRPERFESSRVRWISVSADAPRRLSLPKDLASGGPTPRSIRRSSPARSRATRPEGR
jgi:hypothetical protein